MSYELDILMSGQQYKKLYEKEFDALLSKYNLRKIEMDILFFLSTDEQCYTARDISTFRCLSKAHISKAVENLTGRGFIKAFQDVRDRRCLRLVVTEKARSIIEEIQVINQKITALVYSGLTEEEMTVLENIAKKIIYNIFQGLYAD